MPLLRVYQRPPLRPLGFGAAAGAIHAALFAIAPDFRHPGPPVDRPASALESLVVPFEASPEPTEVRAPELAPTPIARRARASAAVRPAPAPAPEPSIREASTEPPSPGDASAEPSAAAPLGVSSPSGLAVATSSGGGRSGHGTGGTADGSGAVGDSSGAGTRGAGLEDLRGIVARYLAELEAAIGRPPPLRGVRLDDEAGAVVVLVGLTIDPTGSVTRVRLVRSSGHPRIDEHALAFFGGRTRVPAPPRELGWRTHEIRYPIRIVSRGGS